MQIKCDHKLHGIINGEEQTIEVACSSQRCGKEAGVTVLHTYDLRSGQLLNTKKYKTPIKPVRRN